MSQHFPLVKPIVVPGETRLTDFGYELFHNISFLIDGHQQLQEIRFEIGSQNHQSKFLGLSNGSLRIRE